MVERLSLRGGEADAPTTPALRPRERSVSFSADSLLIQPVPTPSARTFVGKYATHEATSRIFRERFCYGFNLDNTANAFGRVSVWSRKGGEGDHILWLTCCFCLGPCLIENQRYGMEAKLHRWHKERGDAVGEPLPSAHRGSGGLCSLRCWPCTRAWLVAEDVGALANFKAIQRLDGWPAGEPWAVPVRRGAPAGQEMEREEIMPMVDSETPVGLGSVPC